MLKNQAVIYFFLLVTIIMAGSSSAQNGTKHVTLDSGQHVQGPLVKESTEFVWIDLGYDVVRIPRDIVESIEIPKNITEEEKSESLIKIDEESEVHIPLIELPYTKIVAARKRIEQKKMLEQVKLGVVVVSNSKGLGTGWCIDYDGHIITNNHVVAGEKYQTVTLLRMEGGQLKRHKIEEVEVKSTSPLQDIALLKIDEEDLKDIELHPLPIYRGRQLKGGEEIYAVGNPGMGRQILEHSVSQGIVSAPDRNLNDLLYIQTTAAVNPGNSGGPIINKRGEVVGLVTYKASFQEGIAFALPTYYVHNFLANAKAYEFSKVHPNSNFKYLKPVEP